MKKKLAQKIKDGVKSPFSVPPTAMLLSRKPPKRRASTVKQLDTVLREKGVYMLDTKDRLLEKHAMPWKLPMPSGSGRVEFYSSLFNGLRGMGGTAPQFSVLATHIPTECRCTASGSSGRRRVLLYLWQGARPCPMPPPTTTIRCWRPSTSSRRISTPTSGYIRRALPSSVSRMGDAISITNSQSGQTANGHAHVTRLIHREAVFFYSGFGAENPMLTRAVGVGTATNKLVPYAVEPVTGGFRTQEFTVRIKKIAEKGVTA